MELRAVSLQVRLGGRPILRGIDLTARPGEVLGLIGPNGAGKSTLLRTIACLIAPASGSVLAGAEELRSLPHRRRARLVSFLPQDTTLAANFRVRDLVALARYAHLSRWSAPTSTDARVVDQALGRAGVEELANRPVGTLSGGQRQLVMVAKLLAQDARIVLLDEPVSALDIAYQLQVMRLLRSLAADGHTVVVVLHDLNLAARGCDRIAMLRDGLLHRIGSPTEVLSEEAVSEVYGITCHIDSQPDSRRPRVTALL